mmetsp:Transcript_46754/g.146574  ORF Transcript_46754/g.146574 Transcript_46754/m.146574 type:complete len:333 (-) Transcript_46754:219-1217(-)
MHLHNLDVFQRHAAARRRTGSELLLGVEVLKAFAEEHKVPRLGLALLQHADAALEDDHRLLRLLGAVLDSALDDGLGGVESIPLLGTGRSSCRALRKHTGPTLHPPVTLLLGVRLKVNGGRGALEEQLEAFGQLLDRLDFSNRNGATRVLALQEVRLLLVEAEAVQEEDVVPPGNLGAALDSQRPLAENAGVVVLGVRGADLLLRQGPLCGSLLCGSSCHALLRRSGHRRLHLGRSELRLRSLCCRSLFCCRLLRRQREGHSRDGRLLPPGGGHASSLAVLGEPFSPLALGPLQDPGRPVLHISPGRVVCLAILEVLGVVQLLVVQVGQSGP